MGTILRAITGGESPQARDQRRAKRLADATAAGEAANAQAAAKVKAKAAAAAKAKAAVEAKKKAAAQAATDKKKRTANELAGQQSQAGKLALISTSQGGLADEASTGKRKLFGN